MPVFFIPSNAMAARAAAPHQAKRTPRPGGRLKWQPPPLQHRNKSPESCRAGCLGSGLIHTLSQSRQPIRRPNRRGQRWRSARQICDEGKSESIQGEESVPQGQDFSPAHPVRPNANGHGQKDVIEVRIKQEKRGHCLCSRKKPLCVQDDCLKRKDRQ